MDAPDHSIDLTTLRTSDEVAEILRVDVVTVRRLVSRGELAAYRVGNEYRFSRADLEDYLRRQYLPAREPDDAPPDPEWEATIEHFDRFTTSARQAFIAAREEAMRFNHTYIGTEHLLLGLTYEPGTRGVQVLTRLGVEMQRVRGAMEFIIGRGDRPVSGRIGLTPRAKKALSLAMDEALALGHPDMHIGTEHLLLGLLREGTGIAAVVLQSLAVNLEMARAQVKELSAHGSTESGSRSDRVDSRKEARMDRVSTGSETDAVLLRPLTPEKVRRARERIAAVHDDIRRRGVDPARLPDPVEELVKARDAGTWD